MSKKDRMVDNITGQLYAFQKELKDDIITAKSSITILYMKANKKGANRFDQKDQGTKKKFKCFIIEEKKDCPKTSNKETENKS